MTRPHPRTWRLGAIAALCLVLPGGAQAQIYSCRDASGTLVVSDRRSACQSAVASYPVKGSRSVRSTRQLAGPVPDRLDALIERSAAAHKVRPDLVRAVIQTESAFDPRARSVKGAMGLMQLMPDTATHYGVSDPYDPEENIRGGVSYLRDLLVKYKGNEELALAAYNAGPTAVDRYGQRVPPYPETVAYVDKVRSATSLATPSRSRIYKVVEIVEGREVITYTNKRTTPNAEEIRSARRR